MVPLKRFSFVVLSALALAIAPVGCASTESTSDREPMAAEVISGPSATLVVYGMSCPLCANNVDKQLLEVDGVESVQVDMGTGEVKVALAPDARVTRRQLTEAVDRSGFTVAEVRVP